MERELCVADFVGRPATRFSESVSVMKAKKFFARLVAVASAVMVGTVSIQAAPATNSPPPAPRRPSIIFILADDLGYGDLSCYGQTKFATPNLDRLAAEGMRFTSFYAGSTVCSPSRAALMLGQHTGHLNIRGNGANTTVLANETTVAQVLQAAGYHTCLVGKWGLVNNENQPGVPQKKGFDEFVGFLNNSEAHNYYPEFLWRYDPPNAARAEPFDGKVQFPENGGGRKGKYIPDLFTDAALNFVKNAKPDQFNRYRPFFLCLNYTTPHANNEEFKRAGNGMQVPTDAPYSNEPWSQIEKNKAAMIARMDADIGRFLAKLKELKIETNTVVCFSSDNGPHQEGGVDPKFFQSAGPFRGHKRDLTEGGIRTPLIVRWPAQIKPGQVTDFVSAFWDFLPTAADIAMTQTPKGIDGISLFPLLTGGAQTNRHEYLYWEFHEHGFQQAIRMGDWKAIRPQAGEKLELYDVKSDPGEKQDVAEKNPEVIAKLEKLFKEARTESDRWPMKPPPEKAAAKTKKQP
jgi:uncharacterized sulfatase